MRTMLAAALMLLAVPAGAGSLTVTTTNDAGVARNSGGITISDADLARIITAHRPRFSRPPGKPPLVLSDTDVVQMIIAEALKKAVDRTAGFERAQAARAAMETVAPIDAKPVKP